MTDVVPTLEEWHRAGLIDLNKLSTLGPRLVAAYCKGVGNGQRAVPLEEGIENE